MFCSECGKQLPDNSRFCNFCGAEQGVMPQAEPTPSNAEAKATQKQAKPKKRANILVLLIVFVVAGLIGRFVIAPAMIGDSSKDKKEGGGKPANSASDISYEYEEKDQFGYLKDVYLKEDGITTTYNQIIYLTEDTASGDEGTVKSVYVSFEGKDVDGDTVDEFEELAEGMESEYEQPDVIVSFSGSSDSFKMDIIISSFESYSDSAELAADILGVSTHQGDVLIKDVDRSFKEAGFKQR